MIIDTHSHLNFSAFDKDRDKVIKNCLNNNINMIIVGVNYATSKKAVEISEKYKKGVYSAIGLHPLSVETNAKKQNARNAKIPENTSEIKFDYSKYKKLGANSKKNVAIGEIGLDYYHKPKAKSEFPEFKKKQKQILTEQIDLAQELNLPIIFHCRMAHNDFLEILSAPKYKNIKAVIHSFTGNSEQAEKYLKKGFYLGFNGIIFKLNLKAIIKKIPLNKILLETDCPFLVPPKVKDKRNQPIYIEYVAREIAKIKNISFEKICEASYENAKNLFLKI
ncbi:MAG: TatD family hydrolase [Patescibacteria group bacterium]|nr:TatD family hydrolase [Patescibacteria group bacterium]